MGLLVHTEDRLILEQAAAIVAVEEILRGRRLLFCPPPRAQREAEQRSRRRPHLVDPAQGGRGFALARAVTGIAGADREAREECQPAAQMTQRGVMRLQQREQIFQNVCPGNRQA